MGTKKKKIPPVARSLEAHGPDDSDGFTEHRMRKILTPDEFADFKRWMRGQTIKVYGSQAIYYIDDVMRWAYGMDRWRAEAAPTKTHG